MSVALPDVLGFVMTALESEGALCETDEEAARAMAVLPAACARRLEIPETTTLAVRAENGGEVGCGFGSPLLEKLVAEARILCPAASLRLDLDPPRPSHVSSLAGRFVLRNGLVEVGQVTMAPARYAVAYVAWAAEADDRREGVVPVIAAPDGTEPDEGVRARLDVISATLFSRVPGAIEGTGDAARWIAVRTRRAVRAVTIPVIADVARRHARDHERVATYFAALIKEARAPKRKVETAAIEAKVEHLVAERDKKLRDLGERFAVRVRAQLAAIAWVEVPGALVSVKLRRRKEARTISLRVPAGAATVDALPCDGCGAPTGKPAACDDRLHLLCEECAPVAQGRLACRACAAPRR